MKTTHPINRTSVLQLLSFHIGKEHGISGDAIAEWFTQEKPTEGSRRLVRKVIEDLRNDGHPICGYPGEGYYTPANEQELIDTCLFLYSRAMTSLKQVARMRGVAELDLKGQLRLNT